MLYSELINKAIDLAYEYHHGQRDKAGRPYILHVLHVAEQMDDDISTCVALLHDILEDTHIDSAYLEREFPDEIIEAVKVLTRKHGIDYMSYIEEVSKNPIARKVKLADLEHNLDDTRFAGSDRKLPERLEKRYRKAQQILR